MRNIAKKTPKVAEKDQRVFLDGKLMPCCTVCAYPEHRCSYRQNKEQRPRDCEFLTYRREIKAKEKLKKQQQSPRRLLFCFLIKKPPLRSSKVVVVVFLILDKPKEVDLLGSF